jgi:NAD(P)-dependent dehydrogenase (short-subunit alcohol dehydrogenase family)
VSARLKNEVAVITGAGRGIGREIAMAFAREGAHLVLAARNGTELSATVEACRNAGGTADAVPTDISDWEQVQNLAGHSLRQYGRIDVLVNAAGIHGPIGPTAEIDIGEWASTLQTNLFGALYVCHALLPHFIQRRRGKIILLGGDEVTVSYPNSSAYAASKMAVVRLAETLAEEVKPYGIQVNVIAPGSVNTQRQDEVPAAGFRAGETFERIKQVQSKGSVAVSPEVAASLAVFLASDAAGELTGKLISAPHDPWRDWAGKAAELNATALYTIRRLDPFTLKPLIKEFA